MVLFGDFEIFLGFGGFGVDLGFCGVLWGVGGLLDVLLEG